MMPATLPVIQSVERCLAAGAAYLVTLKRDERDDYALNLTALEAAPTVPLRREQVLEIIPSGSSWSHLLGWHSYFGLPIPADNPRWVLVGVETVLPHPTRGAFPVLHAYAFAQPVGPLLPAHLERLAATINPDNRGVRRLRVHHGLIRALSRTAEEHRSIESWIIREASDMYRKGHPCHFRTLALVDSQLQFLATKPLLVLKPYHLVATVAAIEESFSAQTRGWLDRWQMRKTQP